MEKSQFQLLMQQQEKGNLVVYTDAVAPFNFTSNAFKYMFSTWDEESGDEWTRHTLFPAVFKKAGFYLIQDIKDEKAQGLQQKIGEINKKFKLNYEKPSLDEVQSWIDKANV